MLSDSTIRELCETKDLIVPFNENNLQPCSYDLTLGDTVVVPEKERVIGITTTLDTERTNIKEIHFIIQPKEFILATTKEWVNIPDDIVGQVEGKSSIGRLGLFIQNAGLIDPGFKGTITLELFNASNNYIHLNDISEICQITFTRLDKVCENPYQGRYQNQSGATASRLFEE